MIHEVAYHVHSRRVKFLGDQIAGTIAAEEVCGIFAEHGFIRVHVVDGEYDTRTSWGFVRGIMVGVGVLPLFFVVADDRDMPFIERERRFPFDVEGYGTFFGD